MRHIITEEDKSLILQRMMTYHYNLQVIDDNENVIDTIRDFTISNPTVDGDSMVRRTFSLTVSQKNNIVQYINTHMRFIFRLSIGIYSLQEQSVIWYNMGDYTQVEASTTYDNANNTISFSLADMFARHDGTRNGQVGGAQIISIPCKNEKGEYVEIRTALVNFIKSEGVKKYIVDDLGEFYGIPFNNPTGYEEYRNNNPLWNKLPYDLEFDSGCTDADIISEIINLYPNQQVYYDIYGNFCANMVPSCNNNPIELDDDFLQKILVADGSENVSYNIQAIKNVTEVFGKIYDIDRYVDKCITSGNIYKLELEQYDAYQTYEYIAFTPYSTNVNNMSLQINSLHEIPIYQEYTTTNIPAETIVSGEMCVVRIMKKGANYFAYYMGKYQPHALCVLTHDVNDLYYTKEYFQKKYNCKNITFREEKDSPFTVQKLGEILDVKSGNEFENIVSDSVASQNAIYQNQLSSSMNETITITTKMIPWLDVNIKISYKKAQDTELSEYIIKSVSHDVNNGTTSINMKKFYPLYFV